MFYYENKKKLSTLVQYNSLIFKSQPLKFRNNIIYVMTNETLHCQITFSKLLLLSKKTKFV